LIRVTRIRGADDASLFRSASFARGARPQLTVLKQYGRVLKLEKLIAMTKTPLIARLNEPHGQMSKGAFAIAMLLRMDKVTPDALESCFAAFEHLDKNGDGVLDMADVRHGHHAISAGERAEYDENEDVFPPTPHPTTNDDGGGTADDADEADGADAADDDAFDATSIKHSTSVIEASSDEATSRQPRGFFRGMSGDH
jgi:hypothetical protein